MLFVAPEPVLIGELVRHRHCGAANDQPPRVDSLPGPWMSETGIQDFELPVDLPDVRVAAWGVCLRGTHSSLRGDVCKGPQLVFVLVTSFSVIHAPARRTREGPWSMPRSAWSRGHAAGLTAPACDICGPPLSA